MKNLSWTLLTILIIGVVSVGVWFVIKESGIATGGAKLACLKDQDCVPATCCHPDSCVSSTFKPDCSEVVCTMECRPGTMDCGAGRCGCVDSKCKVIWSE